MLLWMAMPRRWAMVAACSKKVWLMTMVRGLGAAVLVVSVLGAGCTTMTSARDRIVTREASCADVTAEIY
ncbi:MAG TPA: hypothetical protein PKX06_12935, partial [Phenylobacterium sp.]|nr:hypothetical protein [Phenylobacterium sp.]